MYFNYISQSIPRSILLGESGRQLVQWPIKELEKLRTKQVSFDDVNLKSGSVFEVPGITAAQVTISQRKPEMLVKVIVEDFDRLEIFVWGAFLEISIEKLRFFIFYLFF